VTSGSSPLSVQIDEPATLPPRHAKSSFLIGKFIFGNDYTVTHVCQIEIYHIGKLHHEYGIFIVCNGPFVYQCGGTSNACRGVTKWNYLNKAL